MTRDYLGLAAVDILFAATGLAALLGLGFVGSVRAAVRSAGLAFTVGWALYGMREAFPARRTQTGTRGPFGCRRRSRSTTSAASTTGPAASTHFANRDYPPLGPALDATSFHAMGATVAAPLQFQHWLQVAAFFAAIAVLLGRRVRPELLWPSLAALALMPRFGYYVGSSLADETLAMLTALAGVCAALWLLERRRETPSSSRPSRRRQRC